MIAYRAQSTDELRRLLQCAKEGDPRMSTKRWLLGWRDVKHREEFHRAEFYGAKFRIIDGENEVTEGIFETDGLRCNERCYEEFLLGLEWSSVHGWISPLHVLALEAE